MPSIICFGTWFASKTYPHPFNAVCHLHSAKLGMQLDWKNHVEALRTELPHILRTCTSIRNGGIISLVGITLCITWLRDTLYCWRKDLSDKAGACFPFKTVLCDRPQHEDKLKRCTVRKDMKGGGSKPASSFPQSPTLVLLVLMKI